MKTVAKTILRKLPEGWEPRIKGVYHRQRDRIKLLRGYAYDWRTYNNRSGAIHKHRRGVLEAQIIKTYHRVEKGLALPNPRPGFGVEAVELLLAEMKLYIARYGADHTTWRALNTLREYVAFNAQHGISADWVTREILVQEPLHRNVGTDTSGGTRIVHKVDIHAKSVIDLTEFFENRFSVRQFSNVPVPDEAIERAVTMAKKTPSVCNRDSACVFVATSAEKKAALLALQNGNRGFGEQADRILVVTSRMDAFLTVGERYQYWIDGGLYAMSLIYALHSLGIGTCCLNWSVEPDADRALKACAGISDEHAVIMLIAVGNLPDSFRVAQSPRRPLNEVLHYI
jgi:nitroreductase